MSWSESPRTVVPPFARSFEPPVVQGADRFLLDPASADRLLACVGKLPVSRVERPAVVEDRARRRPSTSTGMVSPRGRLDWTDRDEPGHNEHGRFRLTREWTKPKSAGPPRRAEIRISSDLRQGSWCYEDMGRVRPAQGQGRRVGDPSRMRSWGLVVLWLRPWSFGTRDAGAGATFVVGRRPEVVWGIHGNRRPGWLQKPRVAAFDRQDHLYIADLTDRIQVFDRDGKFLRGWRTPDFNVDGRAADDRSSRMLLSCGRHPFYRVLVYLKSCELLFRPK